MAYVFRVSKPIALLHRSFIRIGSSLVAVILFVSLEVSVLGIYASLGRLNSVHADGAGIAFDNARLVPGRLCFGFESAFGVLHACLRVDAGEVAFDAPKQSASGTCFFMHIKWRLYDLSVIYVFVVEHAERPRNICGSRRIRWRRLSRDLLNFVIAHDAIKYRFPERALAAFISSAFSRSAHYSPSGSSRHGRLNRPACEFFGFELLGESAGSALVTDSLEESRYRSVGNQADGNYKNGNRDDKEPRHSKELSQDGSDLHSEYSARLTFDTFDIVINDI